MLDVIDAVGTPEIESEAFLARNDAWVDADLAGVLAQGTVADAVVAVFYGPVIAYGLA